MDEALIGVGGQMIWLDDITLVVHHYRTSKGRRRLEWRAYRDRCIRQLYASGDVTRQELADAAHLSVSRINAILKAGEPPPSRPHLRIVP